MMIRNKKLKNIINIAILSLSFSVIAIGCSKSDVQQNDFEKSLLGKWAYVHDMSETVADFKEDGTLKFEGKKYTYTADNQFITLTDDNEVSTNLRYRYDDDGVYVYIQSTYTRQPDVKGNSIVGVWRCEDKGWTFEFSPKGTFMEDGALTGYYLVDEEAGLIKLMYGESLQDTVFYFSLDGDKLYVEYPWLMRRR